MATVKVLTDEQLRSPAYIHQLATRMTEEGITRMGGFLFLMETLFDFRDDGGMVLDGEGQSIDLHDDVIEDAYAWEVTFSWNTDVQVFAERLPLRRVKSSLIARLRLWDAAYRISGRPITIE